MKLNLKNHLVPCLLLLFMTVQGHAQNSISGTVLDQNQVPVIGAMVQIKGTNIGSITDADGKFTLPNVKAGETLEVSSMGYESVSQIVGEKTVINFTINETSLLLDDVVVVGYGTVKKRDVTGSIASVDAEKILSKTPVNVFDALQGAAAGVQVTTNSGAPGEDATVRIRGTATFGSGANPLYIVDEVQTTDISNINPSDIGSIEVLKDAASAAIYGSRSANGVIIITTKKGEVGAPKVDLKYNHSMGKVAHLIPLTTPKEYRYFNNVRRPLMGKANTAWDVVTDSLRWFANGNGDQFSQVLRMSQKDEINASVSGATKKFNYFSSIGYLNENGIVVNSRYNRINTRVNATYSPFDNLKIGSNFQFSYGKTDGVDMVNILNNAYTWLPHFNTYDAEGEIQSMVGGKFSALAKAVNQVQQSHTFHGTGQMFVEYGITRHLKARANMSGEMNLKRSAQFIPKSLVSGTGHSSGYDLTNLAYNWTAEAYLTYENSVNDHNFTAMLGTSAQEWNIEKSRVYGQDFMNDIIFTLNNATVYPVGENYSELQAHSLASFFLRGTYNWKSRYLLAMNIRYDGSSRFSSSKRWGFFPSVSAGWRFSDEPFMAWTKPALSDSKLRASFGVTGNEDIANYESWPLYKSDGTYNGIGGLSPNLTFADLGWEKTAHYNVGIDLSFFKGRLNLIGDYYVKNTSNLLYSVQVPKETGYKTMTMNVGSMTNKGFEITLNAGIIQTRDWNWDLGFNISNNRSYVNQLADHAPFFAGSENIVYVQEDHLIGEFYGIRHDGIFAYDESNAFDENWNQLTPIFNAGGFDHYEKDGAVYTGTVNKKKQAGVTLKAGDVNWLDSPEDLNGNIDWTADKVKLGCAQPDFYGGLSSLLRWKDLTLNVMFNYSLGGSIYNQALYRRNGYGTSKCAPTPDWIANMWTKAGDIALYPSAKTDRSQNKQSCSDYWIEDASFIRLSSVKLSYSIPFKSNVLRDVKVYAYGNNLLTWTNYSGFDPEFGSGNVLAPGIDTGKYPRTREFGLGFNVGF